MKRLVLSAAAFSLIVVGLICPAAASAQRKSSCLAGKTGKPAAITAREAWEIASARARDWQADAVPFQFTTISVAPLDAEGRSTDWEISFSSGKARAVDMIGVSDGQIRCYAMPGAGGRALKFADQITFDSKKLYDTAQKAGGDKVGPGAKIMAGLEQETSGRPAWYLNYQDAQGREVLNVVIDAQTGKVQNVFHSKK
jgi:hypothetical protein